MNLNDILNQVYNKIGKDAYGNLITPDIYNEAIDYVNIAKVNDFLEVYEEDQEITDNLRPFIVTLGDNGITPLPLDSYGYGILPSDYLRYGRASRYDYENTPTGSNLIYRHIEMVSNKDFSYRLSTSLFSPSLARPVATIQNQKILVRPQGIQTINLTYVRFPNTPVFDYDIITDSGMPYYLPPGTTHENTATLTCNPNFLPGDPSISVEFEYYDDVINDIINELTKYFMINLKDLNSLGVLEIEKGLMP